jgi:hypothetical protein
LKEDCLILEMAMPDLDRPAPLVLPELPELPELKVQQEPPVQAVEEEDFLG